MLYSEYLASLFRVGGIKGRFYMKLVFVLLSLIVLALSSGSALAAGPWKGRVIDAETKEPLSGAVVLAVWDRHYRTPTGGSSYFYEAKEVLTDKDGRFEIPSYISINMLPIISYIYGPVFIIFKPGYGSFPNHRISPPMKRLSHVPPGNNKYGESDLTFEEFFSEEVGAEKEFWASEFLKRRDNPQRIKVAFGVVELPRLKTREERIRNTHSLPVSVPDEKMPQLLELIYREEVELGLNPPKLKGDGR